MTDATLPQATVPHDGTDAEARPIFREDRKVLGISTETCQASSPRWASASWRSRPGSSSSGGGRSRPSSFPARS